MQVRDDDAQKRTPRAGRIRKREREREPIGLSDDTLVSGRGRGRFLCCCSVVLRVLARHAMRYAGECCMDVEGDSTDWTTPGSPADAAHSKQGQYVHGIDTCQGRPVQQ
jgi:hypothetical protein